MLSNGTNRGWHRGALHFTHFPDMVGLHVLLGLACVVTGAVAMLSSETPRPTSGFGTAYFGAWRPFCFGGGLSVVRWAEDYHLFPPRGAFLRGRRDGAHAFATRVAPMDRELHITGMGNVVRPAPDGLLRG